MLLQDPVSPLLPTVVFELVHHGLLELRLQRQLVFAGGFRAVSVIGRIALVVLDRQGVPLVVELVGLASSQVVGEHRGVVPVGKGQFPAQGPRRAGFGDLLDPVGRHPVIGPADPVSVMVRGGQKLPVPVVGIGAGLPVRVGDPLQLGSIVGIACAPSRRV